ncbi:MAG: lipid-A-disaccharide synthase [Holosporales bacterium]|jgi:lipid-A-disaccharide synthase|nr:lipid-A-disaccharide synthase [Holosporales bacterium]
MIGSYSGSLYIIAGEASGDKLGSCVLDNLKEVEASGVGGPLMEARGFHSLFDIREIAVGGILETIHCITRIKMLIRKTVEDIIRRKPRAVLTIDSPEFCFRVTKQVRAAAPEIKLIHLVAPSVWAWRPKRGKAIAEVYDHMMTLFDFEPQYFTKYGLRTTFVGHPAVEEFCGSSDSKESILLLMPGSRVQEIKAHLPIFLEAARGIEADRVVIPTTGSMRQLVKSMVPDDHIEVISDEVEKRELYRNAKLAVVASGTATLHLALSSCPMVVCYRMSPLSYMILKPLVNVKFISLVNLILDVEVVPELIQSACTPASIIDAAGNINNACQSVSFQEIKSRLLPNDISPSRMIATTVEQYLV